MRNISALSAEEVLDLSAEMMEPFCEIVADDAVMNYLGKGEVRKAIPAIVKNHKDAALQLLAVMDGVSVDKLQITPFTLMYRLMELLNDRDMLDFAASSVAQQQRNASGIAMATTEGSAN